MCNLARAIGLLFVLLANVGCDSVVMQHPIGEVVDDAEGRKLDGIWETGNGVTHYRYVSNGKLVIAALEWDDAKSSFIKKEVSVQLTHVGKDTFVSLTGDAPPDSTGNRANSSDDKGQICAQYEVDYQAGELRLFLPSTFQFAAAVNEGKLAGNVTKKGRETHVRVTATAEELAKLVRLEGTEGLFPRNKDAPFAKRLKLPSQ